MNFKTLAETYLESSAYISLSDNSRRMYAVQTQKLIAIGGDLPITDSALVNRPKVVARSSTARSSKVNLSSLWFKAIDKAKGETNVTRIAMRTMLSIIYKWAVLQGELLPMENPVPYIPTRPWAHEPAEKQPFMSDEIDAIENGVRDGIITGHLVAVAYFAITAWDLGCRPEEMYQHELTQLKKRGNDVYFEVWSAKGKPTAELSRLIKLGERTKRMLNWFRSQPAYVNHEKFTFRTDFGRAFSQSLMSIKLKEVCKLVGIPERPLYNTRRGLATQMAMDGHTDADGAARLGITEEVYRKHYRVLPALAKADRGMPSRQR